MLNFSHDQMAQFDTLTYLNFQADMRRHAAAFSPAAASVMGPDALKRTVAHAFALAETYGFTRRGPLRYFVELTLMFGCAFDSDPQCPWVAPSLTQTAGLGELTRADALHKAMTAHLSRIFGADGNAEVRARDKMLESFETLVGPAADQAKTIANYAWLYPEKAEAIGKDNVARLVRWAYKSADTMRLDAPRFGPLFTALMGTYGHGCLTDAQFPWISSTVERSSDADLMFRQLKTKFARHIDAAGR